MWKFLIVLSLGLCCSSKILKEMKVKVINVLILIKFVNWFNGMRLVRIEIMIVIVNMVFLGVWCLLILFKKCGSKLLWLIEYNSCELL